ncbi:diguanylate cyclase, partial [Candidatus Latescibacterota bacterium]
NDVFLKNWVLDGERDIDEIVTYLNEIKMKYGFSSAFFVSEKTQKYYYYNGIFKEISPEDEHDIWYFNFLDLNTDYDLDVDNDQISVGTLTVFINHRLLDFEGNLLGVVGVGLEMKEIGDILLSYQEEYQRLIFMVDSAGVVQIHPDELLIEKSTIADFPEISNLSDRLLSNEEDFNTFVSKQDGRVHFISTRYFPDFEWFLIIVQDESSVLKNVRATLFRSLIIGFFATFFVVIVTIWTVNRFQGRLQIMATTDSLTGLFNRSYFMENFKKECVRTERTNQKLSLVLIDVDKFKHINDSYGHSIGDRVLRDIAKIFMKGLRDMDILGRVGGEEFALLLPETARNGAAEVAERIRKEVNTYYFAFSGGKVTVTISAGIAESESNPVDIKELYNYADNALYKAKKLGRNRVCVYPFDT